MGQARVSGERLFVDYAGDRVPAIVGREAQIMLLHRGKRALSGQGHSSCLEADAPDRNPKPIVSAALMPTTCARVGRQAGKSSAETNGPRPVPVWQVHRRLPYANPRPLFWGAEAISGP